MRYFGENNGGTKMKTEKLLLGDEARAKILSGVHKIAQMVKLTLGPKGRNVLIERTNADPLITNDGVTIAREVKLECPFESIGAQILREASIKTNAEAGDGTTTSIVLAEQIMTKAAKHINNGESPIMLKEGILVAADFIVSQITNTALPITTDEHRRAIAINSCANTTDGTMVAEAVSRVGIDGIVTIEENKTGRTTLSFADGLELSCELASPYFCEDAETLTTTFENARLLITDQKIVSIKDILPILETAAREKYPLCIIADDYTPEVISALIVNKVRAGLRVAALRCGYFADRRDAILGDLCALTNATLVSCDNDLTPANAQISHQGICEKVVMGLETSKFITNSENNQRFADRISQIRAQLLKTEDEYNKTRLGERLARLSNGVAIISVGCATEVEQREKRLRIEDALAATRAACSEGIVAGGGVALLNIQKALSKHIQTIPKSQRIGAQILLEVLQSPFRQICENSGVNADIILPKITKARGFDAKTRRFVCPFTAGIVDPAKVVKCAIKNAASVAGTLLTTEGIVLN
jgi:chaperonin GroEL